MVIKLIAIIMEYVLKGRLAEDGQTMSFPILRDGELRPWFRADYHVYGRLQNYNTNANLLYLAVPENVTIEAGERTVPVPFKQKGQIVDVRRITVSGPSYRTDGLTLVKIHPNIPVKLTAPGGTPYHSFEMLETPASYRNPDEMHQDFIVKDEKSGLLVAERGNRILTSPGLILYPDYCAFRLPGWLAKEFNGSPEFGFSYSEFKEARPGEVLHSHQKIMEPYIGLNGNIPLFVSLEDGSERMEFADPQGVKREYRGEMFNIGKGDVVLPLPYVPHRIVFDDRAQFPFTQYCINYAAEGLENIPADDRVILEKL